MDAFVWLDSWQQQCCGTDFGVGSAVAWPVTRASGTNAWVQELLGPDWAAKVGFVEEHHGGSTDGTLSGVVSAIKVVTCARELRDDPQFGPDRPVFMPVPGTGRLRSVEVADPWEPEPPRPNAGWSFDGWIVELDSAEFAAEPAAGDGR